MADNLREFAGITVADNSSGATKLYSLAAGGTSNGAVIPSKTNKKSEGEQALAALDDGESVAREINNLRLTVAKLERILLSHPTSAGIYIKDISLAAATTAVVPHRLNQRVRFMVTNVRCASGGTAHIYRNDDPVTSTSSLTLRNEGANTATFDLLVFPEV